MECHCRMHRGAHHNGSGLFYTNTGLELLHDSLLFELNRRMGWPVHLNKDGFFFDHSFDPVALDHGYCIDAPGLVPLGGMFCDDYDGPLSLQWHRP